MDNPQLSYKKYLDGDASAFDDIVKAYRSGLTFFINGYVHDLYAAEDICIEAFTCLVTNRRAYNFRYGLKTYLFTIGRNKAIDYLKRRNRLSDSDSVADGSLSAEEQSLEDRVIKSEAYRELYGAIERLPADMKTAVYLFYFERLSYKQAAKVMNKSVKQVDNLLSRARISLRKLLEDRKEELLLV